MQAVKYRKVNVIYFSIILYSIILLYPKYFSGPISSLQSLNPTSTSNETLVKKLPSVIVVGVKKCGTGAMIEILMMHPLVAKQIYGEL